MLHWTERGGPPVTTPGNKSFDSRLVEQAMPRQLGGFSCLIFPPSGAEFCLTIPMEKLRPGALDE